MPPSLGRTQSPKWTVSQESLNRLVRRIDQLGRVSDDSLHLTRTFLSPAMRRANLLVGHWMKEAGLSVREDQVGNIIGRWEGTSSSAKTLILGSHLDTVRAAGRYDGALGVLTAISAVANLRQQRKSFPFAIEVVGFSEEEGVRFSSAYLGSKGYTGTLTHADLAVRDASGRSVKQVIELALGKPATPIPQRRSSKNLIGYFEVHIEQGPVLEKNRAPIGVVTGIAGQTRVRVTFMGKAGHAGTTPLELRRDALAGAAAFIVATEKLAQSKPGLLATVGAINVFPNTGNVIAGRAEHSLDIRHLRDASRRFAVRRLKAIATRIARERKLKVEWKVLQEHAAVLCSSRLTAVLKKTVASVEKKRVQLPSGAGHDAVVLSQIAPIAMLFVRCRHGLSHHPDEYVRPGDIKAALQVTIAFIQALAELN